MQQRIAELTAEAEESISGIRDREGVRARATSGCERFRDRVGRVFDQSMYSTRLRAFYNPMISFLPNLGLAAVLLVGGRQVVNGSITLGEFATFNTYLLMLMFPMRMLGIALGMAQRAVASGNRVFEILDREPRDRAAGATRCRCPPGGGRVALRPRDALLRRRRRRRSPTSTLDVAAGRDGRDRRARPARARRRSWPRSRASTT